MDRPLSGNVQAVVVDVGATGSLGAAKVAETDQEWEGVYKPLPFLFSGLLVLWIALLVLWLWNTWTKRRWQSTNLQWMLTAVPLLKVNVLALSCAFWYSCLAFDTCSFWVAFGVFVSRIFFETSCFVAFLLIAYGYCIMHEQLSVSARRSIAGLASLLYLTLTGYKAAVPQFAVLVVLMYLVLLYVVFYHCSLNVTALQDQLVRLHQEGLPWMVLAVHTKYSMYKRFQAAMVVTVILEVLMHVQSDTLAKAYWVRLLLREVAEALVFAFIGWTFRARDQNPFFNVIPVLQATARRPLPPIYTVKVDAKEVQIMDLTEWQIGVPVPSTHKTSEPDLDRPALLVVVNPSSYYLGEEQPSECSIDNDMAASSYDKIDVQECEGTEKQEPEEDSCRESSVHDEIELEESTASDGSLGMYRKLESSEEEKGIGKQQANVGIVKPEYKAVEMELSKQVDRAVQKGGYAKLEEGEEGNIEKSNKSNKK